MTDNHPRRSHAAVRRVHRQQNIFHIEHQRIDLAVGGDQLIHPAAAAEAVFAGAADQQVVTDVAEQPVVAGAAVEDVVAPLADE